MKTVKEVSQLAGVSVRTLHHYDHIGLLKPTQLSSSGYRLYDEAALLRLQDILLFRTLGLPLKDIHRLLSGGEAVKQAILAEQLALLKLQQKQLAQRIALTQALLKGEKQMDFTALNSKEITALQAEAKEKWGNTAAYQAFTDKNSAADFSALGVQLMPLFKDFAALMALPVHDFKVRAQVAAFQAKITENFYPCTDEVLASLGQLYAEDNRFKTTIDQHAGRGVSDFVSQAIAAYVES